MEQHIWSAKRARPFKIDPSSLLDLIFAVKHVARAVFSCFALVFACACFVAHSQAVGHAEAQGYRVA